MVTRYQTETRPVSWQALDTMSMDLVYEDGKESYKEITVGGKHTNKSMLDLGGSTSTGEFASILRNIQEAARAQFVSSEDQSRPPAPTLVLPVDHVATGSIVIHQPPEAVWQAITDHAHEPQWRADGHVIMTGPTAETFAGTLDASLLNGAQ